MTRFAEGPALYIRCDGRTGQSRPLRSSPPHPRKELKSVCRRRGSPRDDPRIAAAAGGDRAAASALLAELLPRTRNVVRFLLRGDAEVDDFAQNALIEVLRSLPSFRGESSLTTWADRITVRTALRLLGRRQREREERSRAEPELRSLYVAARERRRLHRTPPPGARARYAARCPARSARPAPRRRHERSRARPGARRELRYRQEPAAPRHGATAQALLA